MKKFVFIIIFAILITNLASCGTIGEKTTSATVIYVVTSVVSLLLACGYIFGAKKKDNWFTVLFLSVFVVNLGYFFLSVSKTTELALMSNTLAYFGAAFLPLAMLMIINNVCKIKHSKWITSLFFIITLFAFFIAASPIFGIKLYYKDVYISEVNGVSTLVKSYGVLHPLYMVYLLSYFIMMIISVIRASVKKQLDSTVHAAILLAAVFSNIAVWLLEQLVDINFEFLSVSYIVTELFLLGLHMMLWESDKRIAQACVNDKNTDTEEDPDSEKLKYMLSQLPTLTPTEKRIYELYISGKGTKEILLELNIKENTLKYHNKNIYSKLGVSSRKQLVALALRIK